MDLVNLNALKQRGIVFDGTIGATIQYLENPEWKGNFALAQDAAPQLVTAPNAGIPAYLTNILDPEVIEVVVAPLRSAELYGETQKGSWTDDTITFPVVELTGNVGSYGDFNANGVNSANFNFVNRQSYHFETHSFFGEKEIEKFGVAKLDYVSSVNRASALSLSQFMNKANFFGIAGMQNYGGLNDPSLLPAIVPTTKAAGGLSFVNGTAKEIYNDVIKLYKQLVIQMGGNLTETDAVMTLGLAPESLVEMKKISDYTTQGFTGSAFENIKTMFPNMRVMSVPEMKTSGGNIMQLILDEVNGQKTTYCAFTEKLRTHAVVQDTSSYKQKKSAGTWGTIIRYPIALAQMLGV